MTDRERKERKSGRKIKRQSHKEKGRERKKKV